MSRIKVTVEADGKVVSVLRGDSFIAAVAGRTGEGAMDASVGGVISDRALVFLLAKSVANVARVARSSGLDAVSVVRAGFEAGAFLSGADGVSTEAVEIDGRGAVSRTVRGGL